MRVCRESARCQVAAAVPLAKLLHSSSSCALNGISLGFARSVVVSGCCWWSVLLFMFGLHLGRGGEVGVREKVKVFKTSPYLTAF